MAYVTYTTEAIVCGSRVSNTADKSFLLFTREAGMLWASARSVREERSRQRYALQDFSHIRVSLVKGKTGWRIGSTQAVANYFSAASGRASRGGVAYIIKMLRRYVHGEQSLPTLFDEVVFACVAVAQADDLSYVLKQQQILELRALHALGYIAVPQNLETFIAEPTFAGAASLYKDEDSLQIERLIERASQVSHL